ncbi:hypothetical protein FQN60_017352 [Etheostoma spectabile]|uniref:SAC domain-containing protein n=1 Tax=Etheostoma spectabile TaxID=54343 RepID=A0A5J5DF80_9PERO|nr:hypothetical protein FQN60_017352 [Etheostoma spectabile]
MKSSCINGKVFEWSIISRRSCFRAGVRYYVRGDFHMTCSSSVSCAAIQWTFTKGELSKAAVCVHAGIDSEGHPANYTRGSIPFYWSQRPNLKYKPKPQINKTVNHLDGFQRHFDSQIILYGRQVILNLINQKGSEKPLELAFDKMVTNLGNGMINRMRWHRLQILLDMVAETQDEFGSRMGVIHTGQQIEEQTDFVKMYKNGRPPSVLPFERITWPACVSSRRSWADNADACAKQYAGTGALKTDFTRTGKRTQWGLVMDGWNSMIRYYKNNFSDGFRQDSIDLFLGNYAVDEAVWTTPLRDPKDWKFLTLPIVMVVAFSMCIICLLMAGDTWTETLAYVLFWGSASVVTGGLILFNGLDFVDAPRLVQKEKLD